ncbi:MAG: N-acetylmuramoyl-L-alanine amidase CwlD [Clostridia bacterium]|nr:N-acetylmuramoyl-L-alanine amidase CwlD [Clostridia bacterium]
MFIFYRKRILFMIFIIMLAVIVPIVNKEETMQVVALPVSNKVIVLDAGHGYPDNGAESSNGTSENILNLLITLKVQKLLEEAGATVILTRSDENGIYDLDKNTLRDKKVSDIKNRVKIGNNSSADIFVSIHLNKIPQQQYSGWQTFFRKNDEDSQKLAKLIQNNLNLSIQKENKREEHVITGKYIIEHIEIPTVIVECGFLSNPAEEKLLQTSEYQDKIAWGIYTGIMDYFEK